MIISHKYKIIFIHIPKNAGTFITNILYNLDEELDTSHLGHIKSKDAIILIESIWDKYTKFCVIRNSWDFSVSLFSYIKQHHLHESIKNMSYSDYISFININNFGIKQYDYVSDDNDKIIIDYLIDFNDLENNLIKFFNTIIKIDLDTIMKAIPKSKINKSIRETDYNFYYDEKNIELVYDIYKKDIEKFNFKFNDNSKNKILWPNNIDDININNK